MASIDQSSYIRTTMPEGWCVAGEYADLSERLYYTDTKRIYPPKTISDLAATIHNLLASGNMPENGIPVEPPFPSGVNRIFGIGMIQTPESPEGKVIVLPKV